MFYFCSSGNEHKLQALTLCCAAWTVLMLSQMVPQGWRRSESKVLEFRDCLTTQICQCVLGRNPSPQIPSQNTIKHVSNCGTEKKQSCVSVTSANSNPDPTSHVGKNFRGTAAILTPTWMPAKYNSKKFIEGAGTGKHILPDFVFLPIEGMSSSVVSHLFTMDNKETMASQSN